MLLGTNYHPVHGYTAKQVSKSNAKLVRTPMWDYYDSFLTNAIALGMEPIIVLDSTSLHRLPGKGPLIHMGILAKRYPKIKYWQIGNEPDLEGPSSWTMTPAAYNQLLSWGRSIFHDRCVIAAGMASGNAAWLRDIDLSNCDAIAVHPYGQAPSTWGQWGVGHIGDLINSYKQVTNKPIWITEFGGEEGLFDNEHQRAVYHTDMIRSLANLDCMAAMQFCYTDRMVPGFGMLDTDGNPKETYAAFRDAQP